MSKFKYIDIVIGIMGGFGLGILIGNEFNNTYTTIIGAILILVSIFSIVVFSMEKD